MAGNLTRDEALGRTRLLSVTSYEIDLDLSAPDPERFTSSTLIRFDCAEPGAPVFCELADAQIEELTLNGVALDPRSCYRRESGRIELRALSAVNELRVRARCRYSRTGQGLHHFVDPVDAQVYLHTQFATADAQRVFACFDQPDLKATFAFAVTAPSGWQVASNTATPVPTDARDGALTWRFPPTPRLSTYLAVVVAGPYHVVTAEHPGQPQLAEHTGPPGPTQGDGAGRRAIPLRLLCRASLAQHLDAAQIFDVTRQGLDFFQDAFAMAYPFDSYDQAFVPEFNLGAMENPGCVTFTEEYLFRSRVTDADHERRANTILHEMSHMWFGDLVTMQWWDDLWLNESFATYAATLCQVRATGWTQAWATFADTYKARAIAADQLPSTHPVAADIVDILSMEVNFDAITYQKGASVLKQLVATIGEDTFLAGLRQYFRRHAWASSTLGDLLAAMQQQSGRDLGPWSRAWLQTAGPNTLRPVFEVDQQGRYRDVAVHQSAPAQHPTLRSHRIAIGLYDQTPAGLTRRRRIELDVEGEVTVVADLAGEPRADLLLLNDDDLTYAKIRLDPHSLGVVTTSMGQIGDPLTQAICWMIVWDLVRDGELPAGQYISLVLGAVGSITAAAPLRTQLEHARFAAQHYAPPPQRGARPPGGPGDGGPVAVRLGDGLLELARAGEPGGGAQLAYLQTFLALAGTGPQLDVVAGLLEGSAVVAGVSVDTDLRWALLWALVAGGRAGQDRIEAELERDRTSKGARDAARCRAAIPTAAAKAAAWEQIVSGALPIATLRASLEGFAVPAHADLLEPYAQRYFEALEVAVRAWPSELTQVFARLAYPATTVCEATLERTDEYLARAQPPGWLRRLVLESRDELARTIRARAST
jgi:aminopeptidase N